MKFGNIWHGWRCLIRLHTFMSRSAHKLWPKKKDDTNYLPVLDQSNTSWDKSPPSSFTHPQMIKTHTLNTAAIKKKQKKTKKPLEQLVHCTTWIPLWGPRISPVEFVIKGDWRPQGISKACLEWLARLEPLIIRLVLATWPDRDTSELHT